MATLDRSDVASSFADLSQMLDKSRERLDRIDRYLRGEQHHPYTPPEANREYRELVSKSTTNWLQLVLSAPAQALYVDGYRSSGSGENARPWRIWQANGLDARQAAVYRAAMGYGVAYTRARAAVDPLTSEPTPQIRGVSPRRMIAGYRDPHDDWPELALHVLEQSDRMVRAEVLDDVNVWTLKATKSEAGHDWEYAVGDPVPHGASVVPVVRFPDLPDLEGRHPGTIEPLIPIQDRINQTTFDTLMTQTFASFVVRTVSGMTLIEEHDDQDPEATAAAMAAARSAKLRLSQDRILAAEDPDTKFGTLDGSPLAPFIDAQEANVRHLAAVSQTPPHHLLGQMANLSAEALVAAETSLSRKVEERQKQFGESWEQTLRLAAWIAGDRESATDLSAEVKWKDHESRSLAATADALGKLAEMLGVPRQGLWERIPGVTDQELERWERLAAEDDSLGLLTELLGQQQVQDVA